MGLSIRLRPLFFCWCGRAFMVALLHGVGGGLMVGYTLLVWIDVWLYFVRGGLTLLCVVEMELALLL